MKFSGNGNYNHPTFGRVDLYRVGLLAAIVNDWNRIRAIGLMGQRGGRYSKGFLPYLSRQFSMMVREAKSKDWNSLQNTFNGYLAEPVNWPRGLTRCGSGWTKGRALRSLERQSRRSGAV